MGGRAINEIAADILQYMSYPNDEKALRYITYVQNILSSAEFTVMSLCNGSNVTAIGRNSVGADGNAAFLPLPGGISMSFTSWGVYTPEGGQTQRIGLSPDI